MRITGIGHAGARIDTAAGSVLCDPWSSAAYFGSWFPFPDNAALDWDALGDVDYLYVSHLHRDHFDPALLRRAVRRNTTVLLPDYPTSELHDALRDLGFRRFVETVSGEPIDLDGLRVMILALTSPTDGPIGDSVLALDDGQHRLLNQNDARPGNPDDLTAFGSYDMMMVQFSGAIWYPMVYDLPDRAKQNLGIAKRERQFDRTMRYIESVNPRYVIPNAGPPCFLDEPLRRWNDTKADPGNIFPDQTVFLAHMRSVGHDEGRLLLPGTRIDLAEPGAPEHHSLSDKDIAHIFGDKETYLDEYAARRADELAAEHASWAEGEIDLLAALKGELEPLMEESTSIVKGVGGPVRLELGEVELVIDFPNCQVREYAGEKCRYAFVIAPELVKRVLLDGDIDWVNRLFLSLRFQAKRIGPYNEYIYTFFKCLNSERMQYAEGWYAEMGDGGKDIALEGWKVQERCPHLKADLSRFGKVSDDGVLTCQMHGWRWRLSDGKCLTADGHPLRSAKITDAEVAPSGGE